MESWLAYCLLAAPIPVGAVFAFRELLAVVHARDEVGQYLNDFVEWCNGGGKSAERYASLVERSGVIQDRLGVYGRCSIQRPYQNFMIHGYAIVVNGLLDLRQDFDLYASSGIAPALRSQIDAIESCLRRHRGSLEARRKAILLELRSPIFLYVGGVRAVMRVPFLILAAAGLVDDASPRAGWLLRWLAGIGSLALAAITVAKALRDMGWIAV